MLVTVLLVIFLLWLSLRTWQRRLYIRLSVNLKKGIRSLPLVGIGYLFFGNDEDRMKAFKQIGRYAIKHGGIVSRWNMNRFFMVIADPAIAEYVLKSCLEKGDLMQLTSVVMGNASLIAPVSIWRPRRKVLAPTFSPKNLSRFMDVFVQQSSIMVDKLQRVTGRGPFSIWPYITTCTMDSICETTLGVQINAQENPDQPFLKAMDELLQLAASHICKPWICSEFIYKRLPQYKVALKLKQVVFEFINQIIKKKQTVIAERCGQTSEIDSESLQNGTISFLELLIESSHRGKGYNDTELQEEILTLVMAGTDTSAVGVSFTTMMLANYPDVQNKVYEEIQEIFGNADWPINDKDLPRLKYLDAVIKETLRLYPPVPIIIRKVDKNLKIPSGMTLVQGCTLLINIWAINRNPKYWGDDAEKFRPERFLDTPLKHPAAFMAFSSGPRGCLGYQYAMMSMKTMLVALVRKYRVLPHKETHRDMKPSEVPLRVKFNMMMRHVEDYCVQLEPRS